MGVTAEEFLWREWVLGEERFKGKGARSEPRPKSIRPRIPDPWWERLEEHLVRRNDRHEVGRDGGKPPVTTTPAVPGQLTVHFNVREFDCHDGRRVPAMAVPALKRLCVRYLEPMRMVFGPATVMSGYRPADYNRRIGGVRSSQHVYELTPDSVAADLIFRTGTPAQWAKLADQLGAGGVGTYDTFVHVDNRPGRARWNG